jgi:hypothetical protein
VKVDREIQLHHQRQLQHQLLQLLHQLHLLKLWRHRDVDS